MSAPITALAGSLADPPPRPPCDILLLLTGIRASGTHVTIQGQWQYTQLPKDYVHLVRMSQVGVYAYLPPE
jgi:hypothetical protein